MSLRKYILLFNLSICHVDNSACHQMFVEIKPEVLILPFRLPAHGRGTRRNGSANVPPPAPFRPRYQAGAKRPTKKRFYKNVDTVQNGGLASNGQSSLNPVNHGKTEIAWKARNGKYSTGNKPNQNAGKKATRRTTSLDPDRIIAREDGPKESVATGKPVSRALASLRKAKRETLRISAGTTIFAIMAVKLPIKAVQILNELRINKVKRGMHLAGERLRNAIVSLKSSMAFETQDSAGRGPRSPGERFIDFVSRLFAAARRQTNAVKAPKIQEKLSKDQFIEANQPDVGAWVLKIVKNHILNLAKRLFRPIDHPAKEANGPDNDYPRPVNHGSRYEDNTVIKPKHTLTDGHLSYTASQSYNGTVCPLNAENVTGAQNTVSGKVIIGR